MFYRWLTCYAVRADRSNNHALERRRMTCEPFGSRSSSLQSRRALLADSISLAKLALRNYPLNKLLGNFWVRCQVLFTSQHRWYTSIFVSADIESLCVVFGTLLPNEEYLRHSQNSQWDSRTLHNVIERKCWFL